MPIPAAMLPHTAQRIRPSTSTNAYNDTTRNYTVPPATSTSVVGRFEQNRSSEPRTDGREPAIREWTFFTNESDITEFDRLTFGSLTFEVEGPPAPAYDGAGFHHLEVHLRKVDG